MGPVSDRGDGWQSPGGEPWSSPAFGEPPSSSATPSPVVPQLPPPPGAYTPPPKPGLIPLRPLSFGALLGAPFKVIRHARALIGLSIAMQLVILVVTFGLVFGVIFGLAGRVSDFTDPDQQALIAGTVAGGVLAFLALLTFSLVASALIQGFVIVDVSRATLGRTSTIKLLWARVKPFFWRLIGWTALLGAFTFVVMLVIGLIAVSGLAFGDPIGLVVSIPIALVLGLGAVVGVVFVTVKLSMVPSALVLERLTVRQAVSRSWRLTQQNFWRTFGIQVLVTIIMSFAAQVITTPISFLTFLGPVIDPNGTGAAIAITLGTTLLTSVVSVLVGAVSTIVVSAATGLIYIDLRMRKEGLDLTLQRWVERPDDTDPYAPGAV